MRQVITIGTPFAGDAEQTHASWVYRLVNGQALRDGMTGGGGWGALLELFAKAATNQT